MSLLRSVFSRTFTLSTVRSSTTVPAVCLVSHQNRFFSNSSQNYKKDVLKSAPGWNEDNASESEADIKADREQSPKDVKELQKESIEHMEAHRNDGKTVDGFGSFNKAVNDFRHDFGQEVGSVERKMQQKGEQVFRDVKNAADDWSKSAEKESASWKKSVEDKTEDWKKSAEKVDNWAKSAEKEAGSVVNEFKKSTTKFVKKHVGKF